MLYEAVQNYVFTIHYQIILMCYRTQSRRSDFCYWVEKREAATNSRLDGVQAAKGTRLVWLVCNKLDVHTKHKVA